LSQRICQAACRFEWTEVVELSKTGSITRRFQALFKAAILAWPLHSTGADSH
jgi:hypothetical protein